MSYRDEGYKLVRLPSEEQMIDKEMAEEWRCSQCNKYMRYEGWVKTGSYIALAVCSDCNISEAF